MTARFRDIPVVMRRGTHLRNKIQEYLDRHFALDEPVPEPNVTKPSNTANDLTKIEATIQRICENIKAFKGPHHGPEYRRINESLLELQNKLDVEHRNSNAQKRKGLQSTISKAMIEVAYKLHPDDQTCADCT